GQDEDAHARVDRELGQGVAEQGDEVSRHRVALGGSVQRDQARRASSFAEDQGLAHGWASSGAGNMSSMKAEARAFPWVSSLRERLAPPARARSMTKLNASTRGRE